MQTSKKIVPFSVTDPNVTHVVIELFGGDNNLSSYVMKDLKEMAEGMDGSIAVIALADYFDKRASVIEVTPLKGIRILEEWGEIDTGDPETLANFIARALLTYRKAPHKALGFWDHGSGVFDEYDPNENFIGRNLSHLTNITRAARTRDRSLPSRSLFMSRSRVASAPAMRAMLHDVTNGGVLTNYEALGVLNRAFADAGHDDRIDLIFSDTCLNGMIEVLYQFRDFARVVIGSEELEPGDGWDYYTWFQQMSANPPQTAAEWARQAVESFRLSYETQPRNFPVTMGAFHTDGDLVDSIASLVGTLSKHGENGFNWLQLARTHSQSFAARSTYDIKDVMINLKAIATDKKVKDACTRVIKAFDDAHIHSIALGAQVDQAHGLALWLPAGKNDFLNTAGNYRKLNFNKVTKWVEFQEKYYS